MKERVNEMIGLSFEGRIKLENRQNMKKEKNTPFEFSALMLTKIKDWKKSTRARDKI